MKGYAGLILGAWLVAVGCSKDAQPDGPGEAFCRGYCRLVARCVAESGTCETQCVEQRPTLSELSVDGAERLGDCIAGFDCSLLYDDNAWKQASQSCWDTARKEVPPTEHLREFCAQYAETWFECGAWFSTADCEDAFGMWSDGMLNRVSACREQASCSDFEACVHAIFGDA